MTEPLCLAAMAFPPGYQFPHPASEVAHLASQILCACRQVRLRQTRPNFRVVMAFTAGYQFLRPRSELCCHTTPMLSGENATPKTQFLLCNGFSIRVPVLSKFCCWQTTQILCSCCQVRRRDRPNPCVLVSVFPPGYQFLCPGSKLCCQTIQILCACCQVRTVTRRNQAQFPSCISFPTYGFLRPNS